MKIEFNFKILKNNLYYSDIVRYYILFYHNNHIDGLKLIDVTLKN